jgi:hypothetical protein
MRAKTAARPANHERAAGDRPWPAREPGRSARSLPSCPHPMSPPTPPRNVGEGSSEADPSVRASTSRAPASQASCSASMKYTRASAWRSRLNDSHPTTSATSAVRLVRRTRSAGFIGSSSSSNVVFKWPRAGSMSTPGAVVSQRVVSVPVTTSRLSISPASTWGCSSAQRRAQPRPLVRAR